MGLSTRVGSCAGLYACRARVRRRAGSECNVGRGRRLWLALLVVGAVGCGGGSEGASGGGPGAGGAGGTGGLDGGGTGGTGGTTDTGGTGGTEDGGAGTGGSAGSSGTGGEAGTGGTGAGCGDGIQQMGEECDGSDFGGKTCATAGFASGTLSCTPTCTIDVSGCSGSVAQCGNSLKESGEDCDGSDLGGKDCVALGLLGGTLVCRPDCTYDASGCTGPDCGNGVIEGSEACDGQDLAGATCTTLGEGFTGGALACSACQLDKSGCFTCGNDILEDGEECEGADLGSETCLSLGSTGGTLNCNADCTFDRSACFGCGNGIQETGEACDSADLDGKTCATLGQGFTAGMLRCSSTCAFDTSSCTTCGNGTCEKGETATGCASDCGVVDISAGTSHACAVLADGTVRCWGGWKGMRAGGAGDALKPMPIPGISGAQAVSAGREHTCVLTQTGEVWCWGRSGWGQTGAGSLDDEVWPPVKVPNVTGAKSVRSGAHHTCIVTSANQVRCWGRGDHGEVAVTPSASNRFASPQSPTGLGDAVRVGTGQFHTCTVQSTGTARCWGYNATRQLGTTNGLGATDWTQGPTPVANLTFAGMIAGGAGHTCATKTKLGSSMVVCWGDNSKGQLGNNTNVASGVPVGVTGLSTTTIPSSVSAGTDHSCAVVSGAIWCWGGNATGQLGNQDNTDIAFPDQVFGITTGVQVSAGAGFTCARLSDKTSRCWGNNTSGQLGMGFLFPTNVPVRPEGL